VLLSTTLQMFDKVKPSSLLGPFISYEENEVLWLSPSVDLMKAFFFANETAVE
jgi:hypothetical protein